MSLIEQRHPLLGRVQALWKSHQQSGDLPRAESLGPATLGDLAAISVILEASDRSSELQITYSGVMVEALYETSLVGAAASRLTADRDDSEAEARTALETGRPLLMEDEVRLGERRARLARLYLPLADQAGVLCGVAEVEPA
jgi:hypothetical protein